MKKILIATNIVTASLLLLAFMKPGNNKLPESTNLGPVTNISLGVNMNVAKDIVTNYKTGVWNGRKVNNKNYKDARSVWFSLAKLKNFIKDLELKVIGNAVTKPKCTIDDFDLGVRIYFGNYPSTQALWDSSRYGTYFDDHLLPENYMGLHTVMLVPTLYNQDDGFHYDFDPRYVAMSAGKCSAIGIDSVMKILETTSSTVNGQIANNEFYAIMPSNKDNKGLAKKEFVKSKPKQQNLALRSQGGEIPNIDFTNAGTLVPPPYPEDYDAAQRSANSQNSNRVKVTTTYNVPCSGASFMRWADGLPIHCGQYQQQHNATQKSMNTQQFKQE